MAQVLAAFPVIGTFGNLTFYMEDGKNYVRKKSSLTSKRVKKSAEFARTRVHADILKQASQIASVIYQALPPYWRRYWMFRSFTGEAMELLREGKTREEVIAVLRKIYVTEHEGWEARIEERKMKRPFRQVREYRKTKTENRKSVHKDGIRKVVTIFKVPYISNVFYRRKLQNNQPWQSRK